MLKSGLKIIIIKEECTLEKNRRILLESSNIENIYHITDSCIRCNECAEFLGCPAINIDLSEFNDPKYYIDETKCKPNVCQGICKSVCKNNAIKKTIIQRKI